MLHAARWKCRTQKIAKNSPSGRCMDHTLAGVAGAWFIRTR